MPIVADQSNTSRHVPEDVTGYPAQPEMRELIQSALDLGWTLIAYEANALEWLSARHTIEIINPHDAQELQNILQVHQSELTSMKFTNWREEQQAQNILKALKSLPERTPLVVWCGNGHLSKRPLQGWVPMGYQFKKLSGMDPFGIDQTRTVKFTDDSYQFEMVDKFAGDLAVYGGTAGFLSDEAPPVFG